MSPPQPLLRLGPYAIDLAAGTGPDLVIAFASIGHDGTRPPQPEFQRLARRGGATALFVTDAARSWATAPGFEAALGAALARVSPRGRVLALGLSMGAFMALRAAQAIPVHAILAIGPQHRPAAPSERRWRHWTHRLDPGLTAPQVAGPWTLLLHGLADDLGQARGFPTQPGTDHWGLPGLAHADLAGHLKARVGLGGLVGALLAGDRRRALRLLSQAGGQRRDRWA